MPMIEKDERAMEGEVKDSGRPGIKLILECFLKK
jgi:hypothetical protein